MKFAKELERDAVPGSSNLPRNLAGLTARFRVMSESIGQLLTGIEFVMSCKTDC